MTDDPVLFYWFHLFGKENLSDVYNVQLVSWNFHSKTGSRYGQIASARLILRGLKKDRSGNLIKSKSPFILTRLVTVAALLSRYLPSPYPLLRLLSHVPALHYVNNDSLLANEC